MKIVVFKTSAAAQQYQDTPEGAAIEEIGGRRYWSLVNYRELGTEERSAWRDVQRKIIRKPHHSPSRLPTNSLSEDRTPNPLLRSAKFTYSEGTTWDLPALVSQQRHQRHPDDPSNGQFNGQDPLNVGSP